MGWFQHDLGHCSVFRKPKWNRLLQIIVINTLKVIALLWEYSLGLIWTKQWMGVTLHSVSITCEENTVQLSMIGWQIMISDRVLIWIPGIWLFLQGLPASWWNHLHNQHHAKPNCFRKDPDLNMHPLLFSLGKTLSVEVGMELESLQHKGQKEV